MWLGAGGGQKVEVKVKVKTRQGKGWLMSRVRYYLIVRNIDTDRWVPRELPTEEALESEMRNCCRWNAAVLASGMPERVVDFKKLMLLER